MGSIDIGQNIVVREYVSGFWTMFALELLVLLLWRAWHEWRNIDGGLWRHFLTWRNDPVVAALIVCCLYMFAEALSRGWIWILLKRTNDGLPVHDYSLVPIAAGFLAVLASLCAFRVFVPTRYRRRAPWAAVCLAILFMAIAELF